MVANIQVNPNLTTNASGTFNVSSAGYIQGTALNDPAVRNQLSGGILGPNETLPMWGGVAVNNTVAPVGSASNLPSSSLGGYVTRATNVTAGAVGQITGFSVFDQASSMINTPQSPVPLTPSSGYVSWYGLGSLARIAVAVDPSLVSQYGTSISTQLSWDFVNQRLIPLSLTYPATTITGAVWANTSGGQTTFTVGTDLTSFINAGDDINVTGVVSTGGTGAGYNGAFTVVSISSTQIVVVQLSASSPGTYSSGGTVVAGGGVLPVKLLEIQSSNCMAVVFNATAGFGTWNYNAPMAVIQI